MSTRPSPIKVAVWNARASAMEPVGAYVSLDGS